MTTVATYEGQHACRCGGEHESSKLIVVTGGPGAGKTALLETLRKDFCEHVVLLPEAASMLFGGGFPRMLSPSALAAAQRAIFYVQRELEQLALDERKYALVLCDRGTVDGLAYWPLTDRSLFDDTGTTIERELARYGAVVHLRTPPAHNGYNHRNPTRIESAEEAARIDERIASVWRGHPQRSIIETTSSFLEKIEAATAIIEGYLPACCNHHGAPERGARQSTIESP